MVVIRNNVPGTVLMDTTGQPAIPAYSCDQIPGDALAGFVDDHPTDATINFSLNGAGATQGDVLADFSLRGPDPAPLQNLTKPDITGPGVLIYAAFPLNLGAYGTISGTSMSTPHTTGSAALLRKLNPDWTVTETKSALMMTSFDGGTKEDGITPWDADDVGSGRLDLTKAALAGLVMDETVANYLAANPSTGGDPKTLNLPAVRDMDCTPDCSWTRTVRNTRTERTSWTATGNAITPGFNIVVSPSSFTFSGGLGETRELTITATPTTDLTGAVAFGEVVLHENAGISPDERVTVAIKGEGNGGGGITLTAKLRRQQGKRLVALSWSPANGGSVNIVRDGVVLHTTEDDGRAQDRVGARESHTYQVCETDTGTCSNEVTVQIPGSALTKE